MKKTQALVIEQAVYTNAYNAYCTQPESIGCKTQPSRAYRYRNKCKAAEDFLYSLGFRRGDREHDQAMRFYLSDTGLQILALQDKREWQGVTGHTMPLSLPLQIPFENLLSRRQSQRYYTGDKLRFPYLATVIRTCVGYQREETVRMSSAETVTLKRKYFPSAGGLYPVQLWLAVLSVEGLAPGIYFYDSIQDSLIKHGDSKALASLLQAYVVDETQITLQRAAVICLLTGQSMKSMMKYGEQGLSFTLQEIGAVSLLMHQTVTALGLGAVDCASYCQQDCHRVLGFDGLYQAVLHSIVIGVI